MERCPVCRARFNGDAVCYRCSAELGDLLSLETQANFWACQAVRQLAAGHLTGAEQSAVQMCRIHYTPTAGVLLGFIRWLKERNPEEQKPGVLDGFTRFEPVSPDRA